jgi:hypothetical protein
MVPAAIRGDAVMAVNADHSLLMRITNTGSRSFWMLMRRGKFLYALRINRTRPVTELSWLKRPYPLFDLCGI